jgi:hypothetical protein
MQATRICAGGRNSRRALFFEIEWFGDEAVDAWTSRADTAPPRRSGGALSPLEWKSDVKGAAPRSSVPEHLQGSLLRCYFKLMSALSAPYQ